MDRIVEALDLLAAHPAIGDRRRTSLATETFWAVCPALVVSRCHMEGIEILFLERGSLDWETRLGEG